MIRVADFLLGGINIVGTTRREWQSLVAKVERGVSLEEALEQTGIPLEDFEAHLAERMKLGAVDDALLHFTALYAIKVGVNTLTKIALDGPRYAESSRDGAVTNTLTPISSDLEAAKALVAFGIKARGMIAFSTQPNPGSSKDGPNDLKKDLWDFAAIGPWKDLKNPADQ